VWTVWALLAAILTFPIQHWVIHTMARDGTEDAVSATLPRLVLGALVLAATVGVVGWAAGDRVFGSPQVLWPVLIALLAVGAALTGVARGVLAGRGRFRSVAGLVASENIVRLIACSLVVGLGGSVEAYGLAFASGAACVAAFPSAFRFSARTTMRPRVAGFIGALGGGNVIAQVVLSAGPLVLSAMNDDAHEVTALFVTMALCRAPYMIALGLSVQLTGPVTHMMVSGQRAELSRLMRLTAGASIVLASIGALAGLLVGVRVVNAVYGRSSAPSGGVVALVAAGSALALGTLAQSVILAAQAATGRVAGAWAAAMFSAIIIAAAPVEPIVSVALAFAAAEAVALTVMAARPT
jgi:hypothetical protein